MIEVEEVDWDTYAKSFSIFNVKKIFFGKHSKALSSEHWAALYHHEKFHCDNNHLEWRILCFMFAPWMLKSLCYRQEFDSDIYSAKMGYGKQLIEFLSNKPTISSWRYPSASERIQRLTVYIDQYT
jgi:hypothetical protein